MTVVLPGIALRAANPGDREFLRTVYASTRQDEMARVPWSEREKQAFLDMQFEAQDRYYQERYPDTAFLVVERDGAPIGRLYVDREPEEIRLIDIALLPKHRGAGIGGALLADLLDEARRTGRVVRIHVETFNPAMRLYERLGFRRIEERGVYWLMEWSADAAVS
jgi:ribosomal protein S18 acetylase RimI-like enzyme